MESLIRLALVAATSASIGGLERAGRRLAIGLAVGAIVGILGTIAIAWFAAAGWYGLLPQVGPAWAALIIGLILTVLAAILWAIATWRRRRRPPAPSAGLLGALPLATSRLPSGDDVSNMLAQHGVSVLLAAFAAGMFLNRRR